LTSTTQLVFELLGVDTALLQSLDLAVCQAFAIPSQDNVGVFLQIHAWIVSCRASDVARLQGQSSADYRSAPWCQAKALSNDREVGEWGESGSARPRQHDDAEPARGR